MKRKMLFFERFMYVDGVTPINCVMTLRVRGTINPSNLRTALNKVQAKHPLLQARVIEEGGEPYFAFGDEVPEIPLEIVKRVSSEDWRARTAAEWKVPFDAKVGPLLRLVWIRSEEFSELMMIAHHCICDGGSVMTLIREVLQVTDEPETELVPYVSFSALTDLIPNEVLTDPKMQRRVQRRAWLYKVFLAVIASRTRALPASDPYVLYWNANAEELAAINHRCIAEDTNTYAAFCVAFLQAFREIQGRKAKNKIMCPVSIRRFIRSVKSDMLFAFAPTIELSLPKESRGDFWTLARQMKRSIGEKIEGMNAYEDLMLGARMLSSLPRIINFLRSSRGGHDVAFSNMGRLRIPSKYKAFQVEAVVGSTVAVPWRNTNTLIATNFLNAMELSFISNERFLPQREAQTIQQRALELLKQAMAIPHAPRAD
ncbi:MAG: condensation domain-containing protein [Granulicella sp.]